MDQNRVEGFTKGFDGTIKETVGDLTGDAKTQAEGVIEQAVGGAQRTYGKVRDRVTQAGGMASQIDEAGAVLGEAVAERPLTALVIAGAIGYALASLARR